MKNSHFSVYRNQTRKHTKNKDQQSFSSSFFVKPLLPQSKQNRTLARWNLQNASATKLSQLKVHNFKISSNLDLPHSLLFSSMNSCVGNIKHRKTTENKLDIECNLRTHLQLNTRIAPICDWKLKIALVTLLSSRDL